MRKETWVHVGIPIQAVLDDAAKKSIQKQAIMNQYFDGFMDKQEAVRRINDKQLGEA